MGQTDSGQILLCVGSFRVQQAKVTFSISQCEDCLQVTLPLCHPIRSSRSHCKPQSASRLSAPSHLFFVSERCYLVFQILSLKSSSLVIWNIVNWHTLTCCLHFQGRLWECGRLPVSPTTHVYLRSPQVSVEGMLAFNQEEENSTQLTMQQNRALENL